MPEFIEIIENYEQLPFDSKEILVEIINKRFSELRRERLISDTLQSEKEYKEGKFAAGSSNDLFNALNLIE